MSEDFLLRLSARAGAFAFLDAPSKLEVFALSSFSCCLLGSLSSTFPLAANLAVALLALIACRGNSEAQLAGVCGFCFFTIITDVIAMCTRMSGWGGTMTTLNVLLKLGIAANAYRLVDDIGILAAEDGMAPSADVRGASCSSAVGVGNSAVGSAGGGFPSAYHAPAMGDDDYVSMASEATDRNVAVGEATRYRAI